MSKSTTRRAVVAGLAAAPVAALPAVAGAHPDAELLALGRELEEAGRAVEVSQTPYNAAVDRADAMIPPRPDVHRCPQDEWNRWRDQHEQAHAQCGVHELYRAWDAACSRQWRIAQEILDTPAQTVDGLQVKVQTIEAIGDGNNASIEPEEWESLADDIRRLAGKAVAS